MNASWDAEKSQKRCSWEIQTYRQSSFLWCGVIVNCYLPKSLRIISDLCFARCSLLHLSFGDDRCLEILGRESHYGTRLEQIRLPARLVEI